MMEASQLSSKSLEISIKVEPMEDFTGLPGYTGYIYLGDEVAFVQRMHTGKVTTEEQALDFMQHKVIRMLFSNDPDDIYPGD